MSDSAAQIAAGSSPLLEVQDLRVSFARRGRPTTSPVESVSFHIGRGERVAVVGESGSGKSLTALSIMRLVNRVGGAIDPASRIRFDGKELLDLSEESMRLLRGGQIGMVFQDPLTSLDPVHKIGDQIAEAIELHRPHISRKDRRALAVDLLERVRLPRPERLYDSYPHELSGGMRQRVVIAMALAGDPALIIADEPTTALDVTVQAGVLELLHELCETQGVAIMLITHDLSIVAGFTHRVMVMYGGRIIEQAPTAELFRSPEHPYTISLLRSIPPLDRPVARLVAIPGAPPEPGNRPSGCSFHPRCVFSDGDRCTSEEPMLVAIGTGPSRRTAACHYVGTLNTERLAIDEGETVQPASIGESDGVIEPELLVVRNLSKRFGHSGRKAGEVVHAVKEVTLTVRKGGALGIVGESGSGKSTLVRCILRLIAPSAGEVQLDGRDFLAMSSREVRRVRRDVQMIFQDPASSMDAKLRVRRILMEPMRIHGLWGQPGYDNARLTELLDLVSLPVDSLDRYPHEFSGGQRQRIAIARALTLHPKLLVCDEPVSALDVSVRSSVLNLLADLRRDLGLTLLFIAHDLSLVRYLCDRVGVMYQGQLVELADTEKLFLDPQHAHTRELLLAQPAPDPESERQRLGALRSSRLVAATAPVAG